MHFQKFVKILGNVRKHSDIKLVTTERKRNYLMSQPYDLTTKFITEDLLEKKIKRQRYL